MTASNPPRRTLRIPLLTGSHPHVWLLVDVEYERALRRDQVEPVRESHAAGGLRPEDVSQGGPIRSG
jgi:hypothetical protein